MPRTRLLCSPNYLCHTTDDFEASVFLAEATTQHAIMVRQSHIQPVSPFDQPQAARGKKRAREDENDNENLNDNEDAQMDDSHVDTAEDDGPFGGDSDEEELKKPFIWTSYQGYTVRSMAVCLVVSRREPKPVEAEKDNPTETKGAVSSATQQVLENWISSTQMVGWDDLSD